jgi:predicted MFS family arabinose efflux permease
MTCLEPPLTAPDRAPVLAVAPLQVQIRDRPTALSIPRLRLIGLASIIVTFLAASAAPTPLYATYQAAWGFSPLTTTVIFGTYAVAVLASLLTFGRLSDHLGRRPIILAGIVGQITALAIFTGAHSVVALLVARVVQGLAAGAALGAIGAAMLDVDGPRGSIANSTAPGLGTASGSILSAVAAQCLPAPTHLIYLALAAMLVIQGVWVIVALPETVSKDPGAWSSLIPRINLPSGARRPFVTAGPVLFAVWALAGFYASLGPSLIAELARSTSVIYGGLALGTLAGVAAAATYLLRTTPTRSVMFIGIAALTVGVMVTLVSVHASSTVGFFAGTAIAGIGFGAGFQGGIRMVAPLTAAHQRAGVLSLLYIVSYLGLSVPVVLAGVAVANGGGLIATTYVYGSAIIGLALLAAIDLFRHHPNPQGDQP